MEGVVASNGSGNCSDLCVTCGAHTHWTCCGSTDQHSTSCMDNMSKDDGEHNAKLFYNGTNGVPTPAKDLDLRGFGDTYILK